METNLKKLLPILGIVCASITPAFAMDSDKGMDHDKDYTCPDLECCNPCASPRVQCGADVFITADFILWVAKEAGLGFATSGVPSAAPVSTQSQGKVTYPNTKIKPGFKVGLGLVLDHDCWDIDAEYTWLRSNQSTKTVTNTTNDMIALVNTQSQNSHILNVTTASGSWDLTFNNIDLSLGRNYWNSNFLSMRPFVGLKGSWQKQNWNVNYLYTSDSLEDDAKMKQNFWGVGTRAGLEGAFYFNKEFSIYGDFALSALWSQFKNKHKIRHRTVGDATYQYRENWKGSYHNVAPVLEMALGLRWDTWVSCEEYHFMLQAGWELQQWWSQNNFANAAYNNGVRGDLSLQGLTIEARFDF